MNEKKFLIYLDILGFKKLPELIAGKFNEDVIREKFLSEPLKENLKNIEKIGVEWRKGISAIEGSDNYVLFVDDDIDKLLKVIGDLSTIKIFHQDYCFIPLEIAIDVAEIEMTVKDPINLIKVINFLKHDIINPYREIYRKKNREQPIVKDTFILLTCSAFAELSTNYKKECIKYNYSKKDEQEVYFYYMPFSIIERERNILNFLRKIDQSKSDYSGALIDKIFIPPDEFDEIKERLEKDKIVFVTGTTGYGKTYVAIKLLWDWYNRGYIPEWIAGKETKSREEVREKLANIDALLKSHHIIYFEDPFGKTEYEGRDDLKERMNNIINSVKNKRDIYIIITSRKDVFEEFEKSNYSVEEICKFEKELNIIKPSYNYEKRKCILEKWAEEKGCEWFQNKMQKKILFDMLKSKRILPTPLSIHDFVEATIRVKVEEDLQQKMEAYSKAVEKAFADEIKGLYQSGRIDRVLFLCLIFISEHLEIDFVKQQYDKLKTETFEDFENILIEEYRVKTGESKLYTKKKLLFSHPSYSKALPYILDHAGCKNMFCKVLKELSQYNSPKIVWDVAGAISANFDKLPDDVRNLLFKLSEEDTKAGYVANAISIKFFNIPERVRNRLLIKLSEKEKGAWTVAGAIAANFDKLPDDVRSLLFKLSENDQVAGGVASAITYNFDRLPEKVRNLLFKIAEKDKWAYTVAAGVANNFDRLPDDVRNLLFKLSKRNGGKAAVASAIANNFDRLPDDIRNLLFKIFGERKWEMVVAKALLENFEKFPMNIRNELLIKLSERQDPARLVAMTIAKNFDILPEEERFLLYKLSGKAAAMAIANNFDRLPDDIRYLLFEISNKNRGAEVVAMAIAKNFDKFPEDIRTKLLIKLSDNDKAAGGVARIISKNFDKFPNDTRNELLIKLSEKSRATGRLSRIITKNFDTLPEDIKNILFKFSEKNWKGGGVASAIGENFDKLPKDIRNELLVKLSEKEGEERDVSKVISSNFIEIPENLLDRLQEPLQQAIRDKSAVNKKKTKKEASN